MIVSRMFIGGPLAGKMIDVESGQYTYEVAIRPTRFVASFEEAASRVIPPDIVIDRYTYRADDLHGNGTIYPVFVPLPENDPIGLLLRSYRNALEDEA